MTIPKPSAHRAGLLTSSAAVRRALDWTCAAIQHMPGDTDSILSRLRGLPVNPAVAEDVLLDALAFIERSPAYNSKLDVFHSLTGTVNEPFTAAWREARATLLEALITGATPRS